MGIFRRDRDDNIVLNAPYCEFYIPKSFFDSTKKFAEDFSDTMNVLGVFPIGIFENDKLSRIATMKVPIIIKLKVYNSEWRDVTLPSGKTEKCKVCKYFKDDILFSGAIVEDSSNAELFLNAIIAGALPDTLPYTKVIDLWRSNQRLSAVNFGVSSVSLEAILAVCYRSKNNPELKFARKFGASDAVSEYDYQMMSIRQICQYSSTFTSLIFEDFDSMVTSSINRCREGKEEQDSPLEKVIKM